MDVFQSDRGASTIHVRRHVNYVFVRKVVASYVSIDLLCFLFKICKKVGGCREIHIYLFGAVLGR